MIELHNDDKDAAQEETNEFMTRYLHGGKRGGAIVDNMLVLTGERTASDTGHEQQQQQQQQRPLRK